MVIQSCNKLLETHTRTRALISCTVYFRGRGIDRNEATTCPRGFRAPTALCIPSSRRYMSYIIREAMCKPTRRLDHCVQTPSRKRRNDVCGFVRSPVVGSKVVELFPGTWRDSIVTSPLLHHPLHLFHPSC